MSYLATLEQKYMGACQKITALEARIADLEKALTNVAGEQVIPPEFHLTRHEAAILSCLMGRVEAAKETILDHSYGDSFRATGEIPELKIIDVFICKLRKKLKPFGLTINTLWGRGYSLTPESKEKIRKLNERARDVADGISTEPRRRFPSGQRTPAGLA